MKLIITRTSNFSETKPCVEAIKIVVPYWHARICTEKYYNEHFASQEGGLWKSKGKNHKVSNGMIVRQEADREVWGIKVNTMKELLNLVNKYGDIVLSKYGNNCGDKEIYAIEIYDSYRE